MGLTLAIVTLTFIGIALGRFSHIRANRTPITLMGPGILRRTRSAKSLLALDGSPPGNVRTIAQEHISS